MHDPTKEYDPYLNQLIKDLAQAENKLRADLDNRNNEFRSDGNQRVKDSQENVDRMHELIRSYLSGGPTGDMKG